jgi:hypothetical protein
MKLCSHLLMLSFIILSLRSANSQGTVIIQHNGATDPTTEGFTLAYNQGLAQPINGDLGMDAWQITIANNSELAYTYSLTPQQQTDISDSNWILSFTLRDLLPTSVPNDFVELIGTSSALFWVAVGSEADGDPYVNGTSSNPDFELKGGGAGYHNYEIVYSATTDTAALWVDGAEEVPDFLSNLSSAGEITRLQWGETQSGPSEANWNLVSFQIIPEPSTLSFLFLGSGILFYVRPRNKKHSKPMSSD